MAEHAGHLLLGRDHGGWSQIHGGVPDETDFEHTDQLLKYFDHHLKGIDSGLSGDARVHYYTLVEGRWKAAESWPPPATPTRFYLGEDGALGTDPPPHASGADVYRVDFAHGTGHRSRWNSLMGVEGGVMYPDRAEADRRLLVYQTAPLAADVEVTGHPVATLYLRSDHDDGAFFVYLEDVAPDGRVTYVTEGMLRGLHRKLATTPPPYRQVVPYRTFARADARPLVPGQVAELVFDLLPVSYVFRTGHSIRIALAGADADHFARVPADGTPTWRVERSPDHPSHVMLPVVAPRE